MDPVGLLASVLGFTKRNVSTRESPVPVHAFPRNRLSGLTPERGAALATVALLFALFGYVLRFGTNAPVMDEWDVAPEYMTYESEGRIRDWVLLRHNEHYYPVARYLYVATMSASGNDFRVGMYVSAGFLGLASFVFLAAAKRLRGRTAWGDLAIPALLLNWGAGFNVLMAYQPAFTIFIFTAAVAVYVIVADAGGRLWDAAAGGIVFALLANGGAGLACAAPYCAWLLVRSCASRRAWGWRVVSALLPAGIALAFGFWVVGQRHLVADPDSLATSHAICLIATGQFLAMGLGTWVIMSYWPAVIGFVVAVYALSFAAVARTVVRDSAERIRALGLAAMALGGLAMAVGVGWGRGCGLIERYATPAAVGFVVVWLTLVRYGPPWPRLFDAAGVLAALALVFGNVDSGTRFGKLQRMYARNLFADIREGLPARFAADRFCGAFVGYDNNPFCERIKSLRQFGFAHFRDLKPDPVLVPLPASWPGPVDFPARNHAEFNAANPPGVALPVPPSGVRATGVAVDYEMTDNNFFLEFRVVWTDPAGIVHKPNVYPPHRRGRYTVRFFVDGVVESARFEVASPADAVRIHRVDWLVAEGSRPD